MKMARTLQDIYDQIIAEKQSMSSLNGLQPGIDSSQTLLSDLTSQSKVAIWRLMFWVVAYITWWHEMLFDQHKAEIEARAAELITGTALWYRDQALVFQYGDDLQWNGNRYVYNPINVNNQIIKRAAVIEIGGQVRLKVAKLDGSGLPIPLTVPELDAFKAYIQQIKFAGTNTAVITKDGDDLKLSIKIFYDPLVLDSSGSLISTPGTKPVEDAIINYIQNLPFNGTLDLNALTDAMQQATGVISPFILSAEGRSLPSAYQPIADFYTADAGHMRIDPLIPINTMITYQANV